MVNDVVTNEQVHHYQTRMFHCIYHLHIEHSMLEDKSITEGAGPTSKNYESWTITKKGLGINFDSYQVAPYVAGPQFVMVPYSAIKEHVNPDGPLGQLAK